MRRDCAGGCGGLVRINGGADYPPDADAPKCRECRRKARERPCEQCGRVFASAGWHHGQRFCGVRCKAENQTGKPRAR